ncbi:MAG: DNA-directed RNA polymerase subunit alpha [bacterium]|nr:DNA-directed RNA polymerase subunit alpha [bacterium]
MQSELQMPKKLTWETETLSDSYGKFILEPLERGYGVTLGNALRRVLLASIPGAAVTSVKIDGILHELQPIPGVVEDTIDILLNLKNLFIKMTTDEPQTVYLDEHGEKKVTAADIKENQNVIMVNRDLPIATLNGDGALRIEMTVAKGLGYVPAEKNKPPHQSVGTMLIDSIFSPVRRVKYDVEPTRVGQITDYEKLILALWTNGTISPQEAVSEAAKILENHLKIFITGGVEEKVVVEPPKPVLTVVDHTVPKENDNLNKNVDDLELSVRAFNCLKAAGIKTIHELVLKSEPEMLKYRNFGRKSLNEIEELLTRWNLSLGMKLDEQGKLIPPAEEELRAARRRGRKPSR